MSPLPPPAPAAPAAPAAPPAALLATPPAALLATPPAALPAPPPAASPAAPPAALPAATAHPSSAAIALSAPAGGVLPASSSPGTVAAGLLLAALAVAALVLARRRRRAPRLVEIVESASLGPKRSLVVARMGGELLVLGSSEGGITLLATRPASAVAADVRLHSGAPEDEAAELSGALRGGPAPGHAGRGSPLDLVAALRRRLRPGGAAFEGALSAASLAESGEDAELRRKLAAGQSGSVR